MLCLLDVSNLIGLFAWEWWTLKGAAASYRLIMLNLRDRVKGGDISYTNLGTGMV